MIDFQEHFDRLQNAMSEEYAPGKNCVDKIDEQIWWKKVMKVINEISSESAEELQKETGKPYPKDSQVIVPVKSAEELQKKTGESYDLLFWLILMVILVDSNGNIIVARKNLKYSEAPPTRLLSMTLVLSYWLGFLDESGNHELHKGNSLARASRSSSSTSKRFSGPPNRGITMCLYFIIMQPRICEAYLKPYLLLLQLLLPCSC
jgi:hypothetical protein